ncbi:CAT RNA binding domain-containing protein [Selenomonas sp. GACV-9]
MLIKKILNNNVIVTSDEDGCEVVAMGRGIFGRHGASIRRNLPWRRKL